MIVELIFSFHYQDSLFLGTFTFPEDKNEKYFIKVGIILLCQR